MPERFSSNEVVRALELVRIPKKIAARFPREIQRRSWKHGYRSSEPENTARRNIPKHLKPSRYLTEEFKSKL